MNPLRAHTLTGVLALLLCLPATAQVSHPSRSTADDWAEEKALADAEPAPPLDGEAMTLKLLVDGAAEAAPLIVTGEIRALRAVRVDEGRKIMTLAGLRVERRFRSKGQEAAISGDEGELLELAFPGGAIGELAQRVGGVPLLEVGDRLLLFLRPRPGRSPSGTVRWAPSLLGISVWRLEGDAAVLAPEAVRLVFREKAPPGGGEAPRLPLADLPALISNEDPGP